MMFQGDCGEAMDFYMGIFSDAKVRDIVRYSPDEAGATGTIKSATFSIGSLAVRCADSPVKHEFSFTPSFSLFIECETEEEIRRLTTALSRDGVVLMPLGGYGFSRLFAWVNDRFAVSWQLNLAAN
jgi:predicted 3-demethylubiquinone-9 3-methyltransferase (glyoxalase superfamily)